MCLAGNSPENLASTRQPSSKWPADMCRTQLGLCHSSLYVLTVFVGG